tara:strand:+ start:201 stop:986 length:786 start_codon:yes stop_codon:yes gene_type:complete
MCLSGVELKFLSFFLLALIPILIEEKRFIGASPQLTRDITVTFTDHSLMVYYMFSNRDLFSLIEKEGNAEQKVKRFSALNEPRCLSHMRFSTKQEAYRYKMKLTLFWMQDLTRGHIKVKQLRTDYYALLNLIESENPDAFEQSAFVQTQLAEFDVRGHWRELRDVDMNPMHAKEPSYVKAMIRNIIDVFRYAYPDSLESADWTMDVENGGRIECYYDSPHMFKRFRNMVGTRHDAGYWVDIPMRHAKHEITYKRFKRTQTD